MFVVQVSAVAKSSGDAVLKFEPFVLHVQCRRLEDAQLMVRTTVCLCVCEHFSSVTLSFSCINLRHQANYMVTAVDVVCNCI